MDGDSGGGVYFFDSMKRVWNLAAITSRTPALNLDAMCKGWDVEKWCEAAPKKSKKELDKFLSKVRK